MKKVFALAIQFVLLFITNSMGMTSSEISVEINPSEIKSKLTTMDMLEPLISSYELTITSLRTSIISLEEIIPKLKKQMVFQGRGFSNFLVNRIGFNEFEKISSSFIKTQADLTRAESELKQNKEKLLRYESKLVDSIVEFSSLKDELFSCVKKSDRPLYELYVNILIRSDSEFTDHITLPEIFNKWIFSIAQHCACICFEANSFDISALTPKSMQEFVDAVKEGLISPTGILITEGCSLESRKVFADAVEGGVFRNLNDLRYEAIEGDNFLIGRLSRTYIPNVYRVYFEIPESQKETFLSFIQWKKLIEISDISVIFYKRYEREILEKSGLESAISAQKRRFSELAKKLRIVAQ